MRILIKPINSEKAELISELNNRYTFVVDKRANKIEIKNAVESAYGVAVTKVRTMIYPATRAVKYTKKGISTALNGAYKKAIVDIAEGETIDLYNNINQE